MSDEEEFAQLAAAAIAEASKTEAPAPEPAPPAETTTTTETPPAEEKPAQTETKTEDKPADAAPPAADKPKTDWKAAAAAERAKQAARAKAREQQTNATRELEATKAELARYKAIEAKRETDPLAAAEEFGLSYDKLTKHYIKTLDKKPEQPAPEMPAEVKSAVENFHRLEAEITGLKAQLAQEQRAKVLGAFESEIESTLKAKADDFELTKAADEDGRNLVKAIVGAHWRKTATLDSQGKLVKPGEDLPIEEACKLAEEYFERKQLQRFAQTKKFKALAETKPPPKVEEKKTTAATLSQSLRQGGGEVAQSFGDETAELLAMVKRLEAQQGN